MIAFTNPNTRLRGYPTLMLPDGVDGQVAFDTDIGVPVYYFDSAWRRYSDDSILFCLDCLDFQVAANSQYIPLLFRKF
jgi:hypothetical protein